MATKLGSNDAELGILSYWNEAFTREYFEEGASKSCGCTICKEAIRNVNARHQWNSPPAQVPNLLDGSALDDLE